MSIDEQFKENLVSSTLNLPWLFAHKFFSNIACKKSERKDVCNIPRTIIRYGF